MALCDYGLYGFGRLSKFNRISKGFLASDSSTIHRLQYAVSSEHAKNAECLSVESHGRRCSGLNHKRLRRQCPLHVVRVCVRACVRACVGIADGMSIARAWVCRYSK